MHNLKKNNSQQLLKKNLSKDNYEPNLRRLPSIEQIGKNADYKHDSQEKLPFILNKNKNSTKNTSFDIEKYRKPLLTKLNPIEISQKKKLSKIQDSSLNIRQSFKIQKKESPSKKDGSEEKNIRNSLKIQRSQQKNLEASDNVPLSPIRKRNQTTLDVRMNGDSREAISPIINEIKNLISSETEQEILSTKMYDKKATGQLCTLWWCAIDTLLVSLQKLVKVKKAEQERSKNSPDKKRDQLTRSVRKSQARTDMIKGKSLTRTKPSIEMAKVYCCLEEEIRKNEKYILKFYDDLNHVTLILEALFYEKCLIYLLGSLRKWNHPEEEFYIHNFAVETLPRIRQNRKLIMQNLIESVQNEADMKMKKPKYIAREKKLIQISKHTTILKAQLQICLNSLGSPNRYKLFQYGLGFKEYLGLANLEDRWRNLIFDVKMAPYLKHQEKNKQFLLVIDPLNILYRYNRKEQLLLIDSNVQYFLEEMNKYFEIVFWTHKEKQSSLINFIGSVKKLQLVGVLDKDYFSYKKAKPIKDLEKLGGNFNPKEIIVIDQKQNEKYYENTEYPFVYLINGNHGKVKMCRIKGKLVKMDAEDEQFLIKLANKLRTCANNQGKWEQLRKD